MKEMLGEEWYNILKDELVKQYLFNIKDFVDNRRKEGVIIYPKTKNIFNAYKLTPYNKVRVCIIGQDPYIKEGEAHGLAFSTENNSYTPTLRQLERAVTNYYESNNIVNNQDWSNNLTRWTEQGIMLLNVVLTVEKGKSNSHKNKGWESFTRRTVEELDNKGDVIFLLWGRDAQVLKSSIKKSVIIECEHPVAASYKGGIWNNANCFNRVNEILKEKIQW